VKVDGGSHRRSPSPRKRSPVYQSNPPPRNRKAKYKQPRTPGLTHPPHRVRLLRVKRRIGVERLSLFSAQRLLLGFVFNNEIDGRWHQGISLKATTYFGEPRPVTGLAGPLIGEVLAAEDDGGRPVVGAQFGVVEGLGAEQYYTLAADGVVGILSFVNG